MLAGVVVAALLVMQVFIKRAYQGRLKQEASSLGDQYSPLHSTGVTATVTSSNSITYTGGTTNPADNQYLGDGSDLIQGTVPVGIGESITATRANTTVSSGEKTDASGGEHLYVKPQ